MRPEHAGPRHTSLASVERLAAALFDLAADQDVRAIEALAAVLARQWRNEPGSPPRGRCEAPAAPPFTTKAADADNDVRAICQRVARRALHGSLVDPTRGATAVHRIDESPPWSRDLMPIAMFGPFLFYSRQPPRWQAGDWPGTHSPSQRQIAGLDR